MNRKASNALLSEDQRSLLCAAFAEAPECTRCWERWRHWMGTEDHLDNASFRLVPRLYRNLASQGLGDLHMQRVKGVMRYAWVGNQRQIAQLTPLFRELVARGVEVLILPPASFWMADAAVGPGGANPLVVAVRGGPQQSGKAFDVLLGQGWRPVHPRLPRWALDGFVLSGRALEWRRPDGQRARLLGMLDGPVGGPDPGYWARACPAGEALPGARFLDAHDTIRHLLRQPPDRDPLMAATDLLLALEIRAQLEAGPFPAGLLDGVSVHAGWTGVIAEIRSLLDFRGFPRVAISEGTEADPPARPGGEPGGLRTRSLRQWSIYRERLGSLPGPRRMLLRLPGYLVGKWGLPSLGAVLPRLAWALLRPGAPARSLRRRGSGQ